MSRFTVAGVTGRVGSVVARQLIERHHEVRGVTRDAERAASWATGGGIATVGALDDAAFLTCALDGVDGFFALLPEDPFDPDFRGGRRRMADAMSAAVREVHVPHVVLLSAVGAALAGGNGPAQDLHYFEETLRSSGAKLSILRAAWFQENIGAVLGAASQMGIYPNLMLSADAAMPTVATHDVGQVAAALLVAPPRTSEVIDLIGPMYSPRDLASALGTRLGKALEVVNVPPPARVGALVQAGLPQSFAEEVAELYACFDAGRIRPQGDRALTATTPIHETLAGMIPR